MRMLYAMITRHCNLKCPHCDISRQPEEWNHDKFMDTLNTIEVPDIDLFGGEPTFHKDRFLEVFYNNKKNGVSKIKGVSTNLTILDDDIIAVYKQLGHIATSWNTDRFGSAKVYNQWLTNCELISKEGVNYTLLITLTDDLISQHDPRIFPEYLRSISRDGLKTVQFEHYVGPTANKEYFARSDQWLAEVVRNWNLPDNVRLSNIDRIHKHWMDCREIYTLFPDGTLKNTCPHGDLEVGFCEDCLDCDYASTCMPCKLCKHCSYMFKTREAVQELEAKLNGD